MAVVVPMYFVGRVSSARFCVAPRDLSFVSSYVLAIDKFIKYDI